MNLQWQCLAFAQAPPRLLYQALALRSRVFALEQQCLYQDLDGADLDAQLVVGSLPAADAANEVVATARILSPGVRFAEPSIGRVCTAAEYRRRGLGRALMRFAIRSARERHPGQAIRISAQAYLENFYASLGFEPVSDRYLEDGIAHLEMRLPAPAPARR
jgi:ElaA protein